jgi:hypothetical protein
MTRPGLKRFCFAVLASGFGCTAILAQSTAPPGSEIKEVLDRLPRLEESNRELVIEVKALRSELAAARGTAPGSPDTANAVASVPAHAASTDADQVDVNKARIDELAQTKVDTSQKLPLRVTGMLLFNAYANGRDNGGSENPVIASGTPGDATGGGSLRQTILGLQYESSKTIWGAKVTGSLYTDFFGGTADSLDHFLRLRTATVTLDWGATAVTVGQDKPIISPRDPNSFAQVGVSPLTGAGNLWLWQPQARVEERFHFTASSGLKAQVGVFQTRQLGAEETGYVPYVAVPPITQVTEFSDPGVEGRFEFWKQWGENTRIEIAPGFHENSNHVAGTSVPTHLISTDWLIKPSSYLEFSGFFYSGQNVANLGALPQGFVVGLNGIPRAVHSTGGWAQMRIPVTQRLAFDFFGGTQDDRNSDLFNGYIGDNRAFYGNAQYRIAPNVFLSVEAGQVRTLYLGSGNRLNHHYDLAVAYLF